MKKILLLTLALFSINASASVQVDDADRLVNYIPTFNLELSLIPVNVSTSEYGFLTYHWYMNDDVIKAEADAITKSYPGYELNQTIISTNNDLMISVPAANFSAGMSLTSSSSGDFADGNVTLSKSQFLAIAAAQKADPRGFAKMTGSAKTDFKTYQVIETKTLTPSICQNLVGNGTLGNVLKNTFMYGVQLGQSHAFKSVETEKLYADAISRSCFSVATGLQIKTAAELLKTPLTVSLGENIPVSYKQAMTVNQTIAAPYTLTPTTAR